MPGWKRHLYFVHRWLGIILCAFFALWFVSGIFMMYVEFPQLTSEERRDRSATLDFSEATVAPAQAVGVLSAGQFDRIGTPHANRRAIVADTAAPVDVASIRLAMHLGEPVYRVYPDNGAQPRTVSAITGAVFSRFDRDTAMASARDFALRRHMDPGAVRHIGAIQTDQWTVSSAMDDHRPMHHIALMDDAGTELYVSSSTGEVVRDSTRLERTLNYFAAVTHWLYPTFIRRHVEFWRWMVDLLSGAGVVLGITGLWIGIIRLRRHRKAGTPIIPYRGLMRWHHITGLVFGVVAITWVFSGLLSMNPGGLNPSRSATEEQRLVYSGKALTPDDFVLLPVLPAASRGVDLVETELLHVNGFPYYLATARDGARQLLPADESPPSLPGAAALIGRARELMPGAPLRDAGLQHEYDSYWGSGERGRGGPVLPVIRVRFDDSDRTWFYIDPATGEVLRKMTATNRLYRWLYNGLHSWDFPWLYERRPLWDIVVIAFSLGGLALSLIGIVVSWRRLKLERHLFSVKRRRRLEFIESGGA